MTNSNVNFKELKGLIILKKLERVWKKHYKDFTKHVRVI